MNDIAAKRSNDKKAKIFIVDDHPVLRQGLKQLINQEPDLLFSGGVSSAKDAISAISENTPDLMVIDVSLEGMSGLELAKNILAAHPKMLILFLSMHDESVYVERVLRIGARGYLQKREASESIISAIRKVLAGNIFVSNKWKDKLVHRFANRGTAVTTPFSESLSDRELEVLQLTGQGYATTRIGNELHVSVKTIESHYANIKNKLDLKNSHELIEYAVKWCLSEEEEDHGNHRDVMNSPTQKSNHT